MKYGGDHLRTSLSRMSFVEYFMIDVFAFVAVVLIVILFVLKKLIQLALAKIGKRGKNTTKKIN
jgi:uncharacterized membrane protein YjgN (DUF898 family)